MGFVAGALAMLAGVGLIVRGEGGTARGVRLGVPFARGELPDADGPWRTRDRAGRLRAADASVAERWRDGSTRWLRVEFEAPPGPLLLERGPVEASSVALEVERSAAGIAFLGEALRGSIPAAGPSLAAFATAAGEPIAELRWGEGDEPGTGRAFAVDDAGAFLADLRLRETTPDGADLEIRLRAARLGGIVEFEVRVTNATDAPIPADECGLALVPCEAPLRSIGDRGPDASPELRNRESIVLSRPSSGSGQRPGGNAVGVEGARWRAALSVRRLAESSPLSLEVSETGIVRLRFGPEGDAIGPGESRGARGAILVGPRADDGRAAFAGARAPRRAWADLERACATGVLGPIFPLRASVAADVEKRLFDATRTLIEERERGARDFGDFRISSRSFGNLEYDTPYGFLLAFARTGDADFLEAADDALFHARTVDRIHAHADAAWNGFPRRHGRDHAGTPEAGHGWIEGAVAFARLTGDPAVRAQALSFGEALVRILGGRARRDTERNDGWPLLALSALSDAYPGRGFETARDELAARVLARFRDPGCFHFDARVERGTGRLRVSTWMQGGLLVEALEKYRDSGGPANVVPAVAGVSRFLEKEAFDGRRARLHAFVLVDPATSEVVGRIGSVATPWTLYPVAGLLRASRLTGDPRFARTAAAWLSALKPPLPGLRPRFPANGISIALRSFPFAVGAR